MKDFYSDNLSGVCVEVMDALQKANLRHDKAYFDDEATVEARAKMQAEFTKPVESYVLINGTGVNVVALNAMLPKYGAIIATQNAHICVSECGAIECSGHKVFPVPTPDDKLPLEGLKKAYFHYAGDRHRAQPKVVCLTQPTEKGTLYTQAELKAICDFAHSVGMTVYVDGARLPNALQALGLSMKEMLEDTGVDVFSFGGTKIGAMFGEMLVFLRTDLAEGFRYMQKEYLQLLSKSRFASCQFTALLENKTYLKNARVANEAAKYLGEKLAEIGVEITQKVQTNVVFAVFPPEVAEKLLKDYYFSEWDEYIHEYRLMTAFDSKKEQIDEFVKDVERCVRACR